jgi:hypothetical protein
MMKMAMIMVGGDLCTISRVECHVELEGCRPAILRDVSPTTHPLQLVG